MKSIDLGRSTEESMPTPVTAPKGAKSMSYPCLYVDGGPELADLPDEGEMLVRYKKMSTSTTKRDDGDPRTSVSLDIQKILDVTGDDESDEPTDDEAAGAALDEAADQESKSPSPKDDSEDNGQY